MSVRAARRGRVIGLWRADRDLQVRRPTPATIILDRSAGTAPAAPAASGRSGIEITAFSPR